MRPWLVAIALVHEAGIGLEHGWVVAAGAAQQPVRCKSDTDERPNRSHVSKSEEYGEISDGETVVHTPDLPPSKEGATDFAVAALS